MNSSTENKQYDFILLGNDVGTYFAAAILSKVGFSCCILNQTLAPKSEITLSQWSETVQISSDVTPRLTRYQYLLDSVQYLDPAKRVVFRPIGSAADNYTHSIIAFPRLKLSDPASTIVLTSGENSVAETIAQCVSCDKSILTEQFNKIMRCYDGMPGYLANKISPGNKVNENKDFTALLTHSSKSIIGGVIQENENIFSILSNIAIVGASEALSSASLSTVALASALSMSEEGASTPIGGLAAVKRSLSEVILSCGGYVCSEAPLNEIVIEENGSGSVAKASGVSLDNGKVLTAKKGVLSGLGALCTYTKLIKHRYVNARTRQALSGLQETRPKIIVLFRVNGSKDSLGLKECDYYELEYQGVDNENSSTNTKIAESYLKIWSPSARHHHDMNMGGPSDFPDSSIVAVEQYADNSIVSSNEFLFNEAPISPSPADQSPSSFQMRDDIKGPMVNKSKLRLLESNNVGSVIEINEQITKKLIARATARLFAAYPKCVDKIDKSYVVPPTIGGHNASCSSKRFTADLFSKTDIEGLFLCSSDLAGLGLQGELQAGYLGASAALGYNSNDIILGRNIISDLQNISQ